MRIGHGYDVHRLVEDRKLILGGVEIPFEKGLLGHSDADVLTHAVMDALLGAAALGDIGKHFPDTDERYKGADSIELMRHVVCILGEKGYRVGNIDCTIIAQRPKLAPYIPMMKQRLAETAGVDKTLEAAKAYADNAAITALAETVAAQWAEYQKNPTGYFDSVELFELDTMIGGKGVNDPALVKALAANSAAGIKWLEEISAYLNNVGSFGGASVKRIHRPVNEEGKTVKNN